VKSRWDEADEANAVVAAELANFRQAKSE
jgi:hypothetical protein